MTKKSQVDLSLGKFPINGIYLVIFFMIFLGISYSPITHQDFESRNFDNPITQVSPLDSNRITQNGLCLFVEQTEEKEEERQEENLHDYSLDTILPSFVCDWFLNSLIPKASFGMNSLSYSQIPFYILFQNLKLDLV